MLERLEHEVDGIKKGPLNIWERKRYSDEEVQSYAARLREIIQSYTRMFPPGTPEFMIEDPILEPRRAFKRYRDRAAKRLHELEESDYQVWRVSRVFCWRFENTGLTF